jgi:hypothetical protein
VKHKIFHIITGLNAGGAEMSLYVGAQWQLHRVLARRNERFAERHSPGARTSALSGAFSGSS